jgi:hypothetical protein
MPLVLITSPRQSLWYHNFYLNFVILKVYDERKRDVWKLRIRTKIKMHSWTPWISQLHKLNNRNDSWKWNQFWIMNLPWRYIHTTQTCKTNFNLPRNLVFKQFLQFLTCANGKKVWSFITNLASHNLVIKIVQNLLIHN